MRHHYKYVKYATYFLTYAIPHALGAETAVFSGQRTTVWSHADDDDPLRLWPIRFLGESVEIVRIAGEQHDWTFQPECRGSHDGIDGAPMTGKPGHPEQLASPARDAGRHRQDGNSGEHAVHGSITRATPEYFGQGDRANDNPGAARPSSVQVGMYARIACRQLGQPFAV
jgi:hypothetical protein